MERFDWLNLVQTDSDSHKNSWRYSGFSFPFCWFCWFWGFQLASASGRRGLFMEFVWDELQTRSGAWIPSRQIPIHTRTHGDIQVFHFHFADFADFEDFNRPVHQEGAVCSRSFDRMNYRADWGLEFHLHRICFAQELMDIFIFFISISPILLILRISTGPRFREERSVHDACMGWIIERVEGSNPVDTEPDSHKNSWRYSGFSFPFGRFCWFWGFQQASPSRRSSLFMKLL